jgi:hypothetical protein
VSEHVSRASSRPAQAYPDVSDLIIIVPCVTDEVSVLVLSRVTSREEPLCTSGCDDAISNIPGICPDENVLEKVSTQWQIDDLHESLVVFNEG